MATIDSVLNWAIPTILILIALGFLYTKFIGPWVIPMLSRLFQWMKGKSEESEHHVKLGKEILYE